MQVHDGLAVEAGRGLDAGQAVAGGEIDFLADLGGDELVGPALGRLDLGIDHVDGADFGEDLAGNQTVGPGINLLDAHLQQVDHRQDGGLEALLPHADDGHVDIIDALGLEGLGVRAVEPHGMADLIADQIDRLSMPVNRNDLGAAHRQRDGELLSEAPQTYHCKPSHTGGLLIAPARRAPKQGLRNYLKTVTSF